MTLSVSRGFAGAAVASSGGSTYLLVGGGNDNSNLYTIVDVYTMPARSRSTLQLSTSRREPSAGGIGKFALFAGGTYSCGSITLKFCASTVVDVFDTSTMRNSTLALRSARYRMGVTALGNELIFAGGETSDDNKDHVGTLLGDVTIFDQTQPNSLSERGAALSLPRSRIAAASAGGVAVFAGGYDRTAAASTAVDIYDGTSWRSMGPLPVGLTHARAAAVDGVIVFAGGASFDLAQARDNVIVYASAPPTPQLTPQPTAGLSCTAYSGMCNQCLDPAGNCRYCISVAQSRCIAAIMACLPLESSVRTCPTPTSSPSSSSSSSLPSPLSSLSLSSSSTTTAAPSSTTLALTLSSASDTSNDTMVGGIVAGVIVALVLIAAAVVGILWIVRRRSKSQTGGIQQGPPQELEPHQHSRYASKIHIESNENGNYSSLQHNEVFGEVVVQH